MGNEKKQVKIKKEIVEMGGGDALERRNQGLAMLGQLKFEEQLIRVQKECGWMKEKIATVTADKPPNGSGVKIEEGYGDVCEEHKKMINEKNMIIYELNKKLGEMKIVVLEKDQILGLCKEKLQGFERREAQMKEEVERLRQQESEANRTIEKLRNEVSEAEVREKKLREKSMEACGILEKLKDQKLAAEALLRKSAETMKQVRQKQLESDRTVEELRHQNLEARQTVEDMRGQLLVCEVHKKVSDRTIEEFRRKEVEALKCLEGLRDQKSEAEHVAEMQRRSFDQTMEEIQRKLLEAERTIEELRKTEEDLKQQNSAAYKAAEVFKIKCDKLVPITIRLANVLNVKLDGLVNPESGKRVLRDGTNDGARSSSKSPRISSTCNSGESGPNSLLETGEYTTILPLESGMSTSKRPPSGRDIIEIIDCDDETNLGAEDANVVNLCTNLLPSGSHNSSDLQRRNTSRTWMFGADMLRAFQEDDELCLNAVCALYRQRVSQPESAPRVYYHFESMRGNALAEYLIDGDPLHKRRKSVSQVKKESTETIEKCRRIAVDYYERLFMLYCNGDDPYFGPT